MNDKELLGLCNEYLIYNPETGIFTNRINRGCAKIGEEPGGISSTGYGHIKLNGKTYLAHRLAFLMHNGYLPKIVDHINHDEIDNRIDNLRSCTCQQNQMNRRSNKNTTSKYKGVYWLKKNNKWATQIQIDKKVKNLGYFQNEKDAAIAYNKAAQKHYGEFAYLNEVD